MLGEVSMDILLLISLHLGDTLESFLYRQWLRMVCKSFMSLPQHLRDPFVLDNLDRPTKFHVSLDVVKRMLFQTHRGPSSYEFDVDDRLFFPTVHITAGLLPMTTKWKQRVCYDWFSQKYTQALAMAPHIVVRASKEGRLQSMSSAEQRDVLDAHTTMSLRRATRPSSKSLSVAKGFSKTLLKHVADGTFLRELTAVEMLPQPTRVPNLRKLTLEWRWNTLGIYELHTLDWRRAFFFWAPLVQIQFIFHCDDFMANIEPFETFMTALMNTMTTTCPGMTFGYDCTSHGLLFRIYDIEITGRLEQSAKEVVAQEVEEEAERDRLYRENLEREERERLEEERQRERDLAAHRQRNLVTGFKIRIRLTGFKIRVPIPSARTRKNLLRHNLISEDRRCKCCGTLYPAGSVKVHTFQSWQSRCHRNIAKCKSKV